MDTKNTFALISAAGALALGAVAAHASIAAPNSGSSDAILFAEVVNAAGTGCRGLLRRRHGHQYQHHH